MLALLAAAPRATADESAPSSDKPLSKAKEKYDTDKDGKLSEEEKARMKEDKKEQRAEAHKLALAKYDANHNGKLDPEEKAKMKADEKAEREAKKAERVSENNENKAMPDAAK